MSVLTEVLSWLRRHWLHILVAPAMLIGFTVLHESAHAVFVVLQGGEILEFEVLPSAGAWGYVSYQFPPGISHSPEAVALAPYIMWASSMAVVVVMTLRKSRWPFAVASTAFLWAYLGAAGDIANAALGWVADRHGHNDLASALGPAGPFEVAGLVVIFGATAIAGYPIQRRLYRDGRLTLRAYTILVGLIAVFAAALVLLVAG